MNKIVIYVMYHKHCLGAGYKALLVSMENKNTDIIYTGS